MVFSPLLPILSAQTHTQFRTWLYDVCYTLILQVLTRRCKATLTVLVICVLKFPLLLEKSQVTSPQWKQELAIVIMEKLTTSRHENLDQLFHLGSLSQHICLLISFSLLSSFWKAVIPLSFQLNHIL